MKKYGVSGGYVYQGALSRYTKAEAVKLAIGDMKHQISKRKDIIEDEKTHIKYLKSEIKKLKRK